LKRGLVGARSGPAALRRHYKTRPEPDKTGPLRRLIAEISAGRKFIENLESERLGCGISQTNSHENNLY
jgi:hypothetical protein